MLDGMRMRRIYTILTGDGQPVKTRTDYSELGVEVREGAEGEEKRILLRMMIERGEDEKVVISLIPNISVRVLTERGWEAVGGERRE